MTDSQSTDNDMSGPVHMIGDPPQCSITERPWEDPEFILGTDKQGRVIWCGMDNGDGDGAVVGSPDGCGGVSLATSDDAARHVLIGVGKPADGDSFWYVELRRGAAIRLARQLLLNTLMLGVNFDRDGTSADAEFVFDAIVRTSYTATDASGGEHGVRRTAPDSSPAPRTGTIGADGD
jgi:hypothetical protein